MAVGVSTSDNKEATQNGEHNRQVSLKQPEVELFPWSPAERQHAAICSLFHSGWDRKMVSCHPEKNVDRETVTVF